MRAATLAPSTPMTETDRFATKAYLEDLEAEFRSITKPPHHFSQVGESVVYTVDGDRVRSLYAEIAEVREALRTGLLPF
jgi:deoxyxylulose-5-phosphate synthase